MENRKKKSMISILFIISILFSIYMLLCPVKVQATNPLGIDDVTGGASDFIQAGAQVDNPLKTDDLKDVPSVAYNILLIIGIIVAVIVGLVIAIKMITGSASQKAETKELIIPYVVGCVIIFGAFGIWRIVVLLVNQTQ